MDALMKLKTLRATSRSGSPARQAVEAGIAEIDRLRLDMFGQGIALYAVLEYSHNCCFIAEDESDKARHAEAENLRLRSELHALAVALSEAGGSGRVCPVCDGSGVEYDKAPLTIDQVFGVEDLPKHPCPRCTVSKGEWVECDECGGDGKMRTGVVMIDQLMPCDECNGRGRIRQPVALGVVFDEEDGDG